MAGIENGTMKDMVNFTATERPSYMHMDNEWSVAGVIAVTFAIPTVILILTLNPLCLVVIQRVANIQPATKIFMASLTIFDFGNGLFVVLPETVYATLRYWPFGSFLCIIHETAEYFFYMQCFLSLLLLTADRYLAIAWCLHYPRLMTVRRAQIAVLCSSVLAMITSVLGNIFDKQNASQNLECDNEDTVELVCILNGLLLTGLIAILLMYLHILAIARRQARRIAQESQPAEAHNAPQRVSTKSFTTVIIIVAVVVVGWVPTVVMWLVHTREDFSQEIRNIAYGFYYTTNWVDVVIFCLRNKEFKETLRLMVPACCGTLMQKCNCLRP